MNHRLLILEDRPASGEAMLAAFDNRNIQATLVQNSVEVEKYLAQNPNSGPLVAILDMNLGNHSVTGAEIGKLLQRTYFWNPPELIFYTAHNDLQYWQEAARMGVAMYLHKVNDGHLSVITHARVLMIRHLANELNYKPFHIRDHSQKTSFTDICQETIQSTLQNIIEEHLSIPSYLILSVNNRQFALSSKLDLPLEDSLYAELLQEGDTIPFGSFSSSPLKTRDYPGNTCQTVKDSVLIPLYRSQDVSLYLGIKKQKHAVGTTLESTDNISEAICIHLKPSWLEPFFYQIRTAFQNENKHRDNTLLTARFCQSIGQVQQGFYQAALNHGEVPKEAFHLEKMATVAKGLEAVGKRLQTLVQTHNSLESLCFTDLAQTTWNELAHIAVFSEFNFEIQPNIMVFANRSDLSAALRRIFSWMLGRYDRHKKGVNPQVHIRAEETPEGMVIGLRDNSQRLPPELLEDLFTPFTDAMEFDDGLDAWIGLFMSKILVETRLGGRLQEKTGTLPAEEPGNLLQLTLRPIPKNGQST